MSNFKIGSIIKGNAYASYAITDNRCLCMVVGTPEFYKNVRGERLSNNEIAVLVLAHQSNTNALGSVFPVYDVSFVEVNGINIFESLGTSGEYKFVDRETFDNVLNECCIRFNETTNEFETYEPEVIPSKDDTFTKNDALTDEEKQVIINDTFNYLKEFGYQAKISGTTEAINEWLKQKTKLINMFKQHPNYNGRYQIVTENEFERRIDLDTVRRFREWLSNLDVSDLYYEPVKLGMFTYEEAYIATRKLEKITGLFNSGRVHFINGNRVQYYDEQLDYFYKIMKTYEKDANIHISGTNAYNNEKFKKKVYFNLVLEFLRDNRIAYYTNSDIVYLCEKYICKDYASEEQLMIDLIVNLLEAADVNTMPGYDEKVAELKEALTPGKDQYYTILSVHPIDFLSMGHGTTWTSGESIDKIHHLNKENLNSTYSGVTVSYMLDNSSMVFYTVKKEFAGTEFEKELKSHRNIFHYNDSRLLQDKMYPEVYFDSKCNVFEETRHIVQKMISTCLGVDNKWILKRGDGSCREVITINGKYEKGAFNYSNINVSILKSSMELPHEKVQIGAPQICFNCGKSYHESNMILCRTHHKPKVVCKECKKSYIVENCLYVDSSENPEENGWYCKHHAFYCSKHDRVETGQPAQSTWMGASCEAVADDSTIKVAYTYNNNYFDIITEPDIYDDALYEAV